MSEWRRADSAAWSDAEHVFVLVSLTSPVAALFYSLQTAHCSRPSLLSLSALIAAPDSHLQHTRRSSRTLQLHIAMASTAASAALSAEQQQLYRDLQEQMAIDGTRQQYETKRTAQHRWGWQQWLGQLCS